MTAMREIRTGRREARNAAPLLPPAYRHM